MKKLLLFLSALLLLAALVFTGIYFTRFQSMATLQKITDYSDGYNLYRMDIRYRYSLNDLLARGITDDQSMVDAILEEALPMLPVTIQAPSFGCTAFAVASERLKQPSSASRVIYCNSSRRFSFSSRSFCRRLRSSFSSSALFCIRLSISQKQNAVNADGTPAAINNSIRYVLLSGFFLSLQIITVL